VKNFDFINIDSSIIKPKYQQLIESIVSSIENEVLIKGQQLPSINEIAKNFGMARMTVAKAYDELRERGIISSHHGKGFYVTNTDTRASMNIFVLFDALTPYKEILYDNLVKTLGDEVNISIFFHHHNIKVFENLISTHLGNYNFYVIMPHFNENTAGILSQIPKEKLLILDIDVPEFGDDYAVIYQDFEKNIYEGLSQANQLIKKYESLSLVLSSKSFQYTPTGIIRGFERYCTEYNVSFNIIQDIDENTSLQKGHAYILFRENDLVTFLNWANKQHLRIGSEVGMISYDDTPIKEILLEGITVISNDFPRMGQLAGEMILEHRKGKIANECKLIIRKTL
jgi:DNA-binding transcriptional regulator YhcF (GntR family)